MRQAGHVFVMYKLQILQIKRGLPYRLEGEVALFQHQLGSDGYGV